MDFHNSENTNNYGIRIRSFIRKSYEGQSIFPCISLFLIGVVSVLTSYHMIYASENELKLLWLAPVLLSASSVRLMWNPFRLIILLSIYLFGYSFEMDMWSSIVCATLSTVTSFISIWGWYEFIQKPNDSDLHELLKVKENDLKSLKSDLNKHFYADN